MTRFVFGLTLAAVLFGVLPQCSVGSDDSLSPSDRAPGGEESATRAEEGPDTIEVTEKIPRWCEIVDSHAWLEVERDGVPYLFPRHARDKQSGIELMLIPAGSYLQGSPPDEEGRGDDEGPQHRVTITRPFYLGRYEVTNAQYRRFRSGHDSGSFEGHSLDEHSQPVSGVSWNDATAFCQAYGFRLPSEAEWEYACRAGSTTRYPWGDGPDAGRGWANCADEVNKPQWSDWRVFSWDDGHAVSAPVGRFRASGFGLHDMIGNVWEWCADSYAKDAYESCTPEATDPRGPPPGEYRVVRGGSWNDGPRRCRSACRSGFSQAGRLYDFRGFRVARSP